MPTAPLIRGAEPPSQFTSSAAAPLPELTPSPAPVGADASATSARLSEQVFPRFGFTPETGDPVADATEEPADPGPEASPEFGPAKKEGAPSTERAFGGLSREEYREVQELKIRDRQVRQHELAHVAAGGRYTNGGPSYQFATGPDGRQYAVAGEVSIDTSKEATPEQTLLKAQVIRRAALATPEPSTQDRSVAAQATKLEAEARREIAEARVEEIANAQEEVALPLRGIPEDFEFTRIGPVEDEEEDGPGSSRFRPPIVSIPVPFPPEARTDIGRLIDFHR